MADAHKNFAYSTVATAPTPASSGTSLVVAAGEGAKFPAAPFNVTIWPTGTDPTTANAEIARVTAVSTDTLTIVRAQEGSGARTVVVGDQIAATVTTKTLTDVEDLAAVLSPTTYDELLTANHQTLVEDSFEVGNGFVTELAATALLSVGTSGYDGVRLGGDVMYGTLQAPYFQAKGDPWYDVRAFGAVADGVTDDGPAIQAAIDTCYQAGGGIVRLPATVGRFLYLTNQQLFVRHKVILRGDGERSTGIKAGGSFPTSTYVVRIGDGSQIVFATRVEDLYIDCNNIVGSGGVYTSEAEEHTGVFGVMVMNYRDYGINFDFVDANHNCQNCGCADLELFPSNSGSNGGIKMIVAGRGFIDQVSIVPSAGAHTDGILVNNSNGVEVSNIQPSGHTDGVHIIGTSNAYVHNVWGSGTGTNVVHLSGSSSDCVLNNIGRGSWTNSLTDDFVGLSWTDPTIRLYTQTEFDLGGARIVQGSGDPEGVVTARVPSVYLRASLLPGASPLNFKASGTGNTGWKPVLFDVFPNEWISTNSEVVRDKAQLLIEDVYELVSNNVLELMNPDGLLCIDSQLDAVLRVGGSMFGELVVPDVSVSGLAGATSGTRFVGATASGAPTTGTFLIGDWVVDRSGAMWVCTVAGTPGTWVQVGVNMAATNGTAALGSDVACATANTFADGPTTGSIGANTQVFQLLGQVTILNGTTAARYTAKLWNGTTTIAEAEMNFAASTLAVIALSGIRTFTGAETWKISCAPTVSTTGGAIKAAAVENSAGNFASRISYVRLA